jgi:hypothetical protein
MDAIDNLIFTSRNQSRIPLPNGGVQAVAPPVSAFWPTNQNLDGTVSPVLPLQGPPDNRSYDAITRHSFVCHDDTDFIEHVFQKHWFDIGYHLAYIPTGAAPPPPVGDIYSNFHNPPYHLIYAFLLENTRIAQIFEKLLTLFTHDEKLAKTTNEAEFRWLVNTEALFYKDAPSASYRSITGSVRPFSEGSRRNAYQRMFGTDLGFGDLKNSGPYPYTKASVSNQTFTALLENFLSEFWQAYTNARNEVGPNTTDIAHITETALRLQEMLMSRRTNRTDFAGYRFYNLSKEEYSATIMMSWLHYIIAGDTPIVTWLNCSANTPGERLINIGNRVELPAHSKSVALIEIAAPMAGLLRSVEIGDFTNQAWTNQIIHANVPNYVPAPTPQQTVIINNILTIINNWEKITGHKIKIRDASQQGMPKSNGVALTGMLVPN